MRRFAKFEHPTGGAWSCGTCDSVVCEGHLCPDCGNVLCDACADKPHQYPAGARAGKPCPNSPAHEAAVEHAAAE